VFQGEFVFDVPQFRLVLEPFMIAAAAGVALVAARLWMWQGRGAGRRRLLVGDPRGIALIVGPALRRDHPHLPPVPRLGGRRRAARAGARPGAAPLLFGAVAGVLIGTLGHLTEAGWTQVVQTLAWGSDIAVEGTLMALVGGVSGGVLGALLALGLRRRLPRPAVARTAFLACLLAMSAALANGLVATVPDDVEATFTFEDVQAEPRTANVAVQLSPADAVDDPSWVQITAWQGDGLVVTNLERTGEGAYRTTEPVPLHGTWKTLLRLHDGRVLTAVPIYLPADEAIQAEEVPATQGVTRGAVPEIEILQREKKSDSSALLVLAANLVVLVCTLAIVASIAWGVGRYARRGSADPAVADRPSPVPTGAGSR
jgi:hypothetical protein